jgi:hypothetical protein
MNTAARPIAVMRALPTGQPRFMSVLESQPPKIEPMLEPV